MSAVLGSQKVPVDWVRVSDAFTYRGRRYMRSGHGRTLAEDYVAFSVIPLEGKQRGERVLKIKGREVTDLRQGSYRPWASDGNRHEGEPVTSHPKVAA
jgi:hypothetical protein